MPASGSTLPLPEDPERWACLTRHEAALLRIARRRCACPQDAADVVQETLTRAAAQSDLRLQDAGAWMTRTLLNLCNDLHRRPRHAPLDDVDIPSELVDFQSPEGALLVREEVAALAARLALLPARQQLAVRLRAQELAVPEIAERMEVPYKTAESLLSRARATLRRA